MNTKNTTPPHTIIANRPYNADEFEKIISRILPEDIFKISIEVWAEEPCMEILRSGLSGEKFDEIAAKASRMIFKGSLADLQAIGVA